MIYGMQSGGANNSVSAIWRHRLTASANIVLLSNLGKISPVNGAQSILFGYIFLFLICLPQW